MKIQRDNILDGGYALLTAINTTSYQDGKDTGAPVAYLVRVRLSAQGFDELVVRFPISAKLPIENAEILTHYSAGRLLVVEFDQDDFIADISEGRRQVDGKWATYLKKTATATGFTIRVIDPDETSVEL